MNEKVLNRIATWFNNYAVIYDYEAKVNRGKLEIYAPDGTLDKKYSFSEYLEVVDMVRDYFDVLFGRIPVDDYDSLGGLEDELIELTLEIKNTKTKDYEKMMVAICTTLHKVSELMTVTEFNEYWREDG